MENAVAKSGWFKSIVDDWVLKFKQTDHMQGGFARYITNSYKFQKKFEMRALEDAAAAITSLTSSAAAVAAPTSRDRPQTPSAAPPSEGAVAAGSAPLPTPPPRLKANFSFAPTRFDTVVEPMKAIFSNLKTCLAVLAEDGDQPWQRGLLCRQFAYEPLVSAALGTEILERGKDWVHSRDQRRRGAYQSICIVQRLNRVFLKDLHDLVEADAPLALAEGSLSHMASVG